MRSRKLRLLDVLNESRLDHPEEFLDPACTIIGSEHVLKFIVSKQTSMNQFNGLLMILVLFKKCTEEVFLQVEATLCLEGPAP
jgi:hypothetical protein